MNGRSLTLTNSVLQAVELVEQEDRDDAIDLCGFNGRFIRLPFVVPLSASACLLLHGGHTARETQRGLIERVIAHCFALP